MECAWAYDRTEKVRDAMTLFPSFAMYGKIQAGKTPITKIALSHVGAFDERGIKSMLLADGTTEAVIKGLLCSCQNMIIGLDDPGLERKEGEDVVSSKLVSASTNGTAAASKQTQPAKWWGI